MSTIASILSPARTIIIADPNFKRKHILEKITDLAAAKQADINPSDILDRKSVV